MTNVLLKTTRLYFSLKFQWLGSYTTDALVKTVSQNLVFYRLKCASSCEIIFWEAQFKITTDAFEFVVSKTRALYTFFSL